MNAEASERPLNILFVCVGNACRSQMAEALARHLAGPRVHSWSAGVRPAGWIPPIVNEVMAEKGISLEGHWSKGLNHILEHEMDVFVCMATELHCSAPPNFQGRTVHWDIPDPYGASVETFREIRDQIEQEVRSLLEELFTLADEPAAAQPHPAP